MDEARALVAVIDSVPPGDAGMANWWARLDTANEAVRRALAESTTPTADLPAKTEVTVRCLCDCGCHGGGYCGLPIDVDEGKRDCDNGCRAGLSDPPIVCDPFIED